MPSAILWSASADGTRRVACYYKILGRGPSTGDFQGISNKNLKTIVEILNDNTHATVIR